MDRKTIRKILTCICERLDAIVAGEIGGLQPAKSILQPSTVRADLNPIGGVTVVIVDPNGNYDRYTSVADGWSNFALEVRSTMEHAKEGGITFWEPGADWKATLERLSQESVRKNKPDFEAVRNTWKAIRQMKSPIIAPGETAFFSPMIERHGFYLEVYYGRIPPDLLALPCTESAISDHFAYHREITVNKKNRPIFSTVAAMKWSYSSDLSSIIGIEACPTLWSRKAGHPDVPEEELNAFKQWAEKEVHAIAEKAGDKPLPIIWIYQEEFYDTQTLANVL
jgi:hypothetical protein